MLKKVKVGNLLLIGNSMLGLFLMQKIAYYSINYMEFTKSFRLAVTSFIVIACIQVLLLAIKYDK